MDGNWDFLLSKMPGLKNITIENQETMIVSSQLFQNTKNIEHIKIRNISTLTFQRFPYLKKLKILDLSSNIRRIPYNVFEKLINLEDLDLSRNELKKLPNLEFNQNLRNLNLGFNKIKILPQISPLQKLKTLILSHNNINT